MLGAEDKERTQSHNLQEIQNMIEKAFVYKQVTVIQSKGYSEESDLALKEFAA